ncbi:MAG: pyridoxamine 5'-phosphate oxidase family protein [Candidatus Altiarchaeota archaeon]|nr:pyridoxamine 5'-phosphate oxidase family protein [Candidatus Altiarchaeota archaeon]
MAEDLEEQIREYIDAHRVCTIAVADGNTPGAHTVYYVNNGLTVYFNSDMKSQKISVLRSNPKISLVIDEDYEDWRAIKGVQMFGRARILDSRDTAGVRDAFNKKLPHLKESGGLPDSYVFVEVIPEKVYYMDFSKHPGHKSVYYPEKEKGGLMSKISW